MFLPGHFHILAFSVAAAFIASRTKAEFAFTSYPTEPERGFTYVISWRGDNGTVNLYLGDNEPNDVLDSLYFGDGNQFYWDVPFNLNSSLIYYFQLEDYHSGNKYETPKFSLYGSNVTTSSGLVDNSATPSPSTVLQTSATPSPSIILQTSATPTQTTPGTDPTMTSYDTNINRQANSNRLSTGAIAGISLGTVAVVLLSITVILLYRRRSFLSPAREGMEKSQSAQLKAQDSETIAQLDSRPISYELPSHTATASVELGSNLGSHTK